MSLTFRITVDNRDSAGRPVVEVNDAVVAAAIALEDEQSYVLLSWGDRLRYERLARAAIEVMGGELV